MDSDSFDWLRLAERQWLDNAQRGYIVVDGQAEEECCGTIYSLADRWLAIPETRPHEVVVNVVHCESGHAASFMLGQRIADLYCETRVMMAAGSAGLFIFMGGDERLARPGAKFTFHGNLYRWMQSGASDEQRAEWFASRTKMSYEWWLEKCKIDGVFSFGVEEALEYGVVTGLLQ
jgi:hypothetical protein